MVHGAPRVIRTPGLRIRSQNLKKGDSSSFSKTLTSSTYKGQVGIAWVKLGYFRVED
jgi:hypothetical protein